MIEAIYSRVGSRIRAARARRHVTQQALARAVGQTRQSVSAIEAGRQRPPLHVLVRLARALRVPPGSLL